MSNGYIQVDFKGQPTGLKFGMLAIENIAKQASEFSEKHGGESNIKNAYLLFYWGLINNYDIKNKDVDFTYEDVCDYVDELSFSASGKEILVNVTQAFMNSRGISSSQQEQTKKKKSKPTGKN